MAGWCAVPITHRVNCLPFPRSTSDLKFPSKCILCLFPLRVGHGSRRLSITGQNAIGVDSVNSSGGHRLQDDTSLPSSCLAMAAALEAASSLPVKIMKDEPTMSLLSSSSEDFLALCTAQLDICAGMLSPGDRLTVYMRTPESYASLQLELQCVALYPDPHPGGVKGEAFILSVDPEGAQPRNAETALVAHEAVELPDRGALVLPLAKGSFVVGLLVAERHSHGSNNELNLPEMRLKRPMWPPPRSLSAPQGKVSSRSSSKADEDMAAARSMQSLQKVTQKPQSGVRKSVFSSREQIEAAKIANTLALACVMDQRAMLVQQSAWQRSVLMDGLIEEVRGPLMAFRSLGRMLIPQLRQGELTRDIVDTMITQGDQVKTVFDKLQQALHPTQTSERKVDYERSDDKMAELDSKGKSAPSNGFRYQQYLPASGESGASKRLGK